MSRTIAMLIAFTAVTTSTAGIGSDKTEPVTKRATAQASKLPAKKAEKSTAAIHTPAELVAEAPTQAQVGAWSMKTVATVPASQITQEASLKEPESDGNLNVYGMLIAALGLGGMSIVRRMGGL